MISKDFKVYLENGKLKSNSFKDEKEIKDRGDSILTPNPIPKAFDFIEFTETLTEQAFIDGYLSHLSKADQASAMTQYKVKEGITFPLVFNKLKVFTGKGDHYVIVNAGGNDAVRMWFDENNAEVK